MQMGEVEWFYRKLSNLLVRVYGVDDDTPRRIADMMTTAYRGILKLPPYTYSLTRLPNPFHIEASPPRLRRMTRPLGRGGLGSRGVLQMTEPRIGRFGDSGMGSMFRSRVQERYFYECDWSLVYRHWIVCLRESKGEEHMAIKSDINRCLDAALTRSRNLNVEGFYRVTLVAILMETWGYQVVEARTLIHQNLVYMIGVLNDERNHDLDLSAW